MKNIRPTYAVLVLAAGLLELFLNGASAFPVVWIGGLIAGMLSVCAAMVSAFTRPITPAHVSVAFTATACAGGHVASQAARSPFDNTPNGRGGINPIFTADDPHGLFL
jgi:hypothetical protein